MPSKLWVRCIPAILAVSLCMSVHAGEDASPLLLRTMGSTTANVFHVVDQLSQWSPYCHAQYVRCFEKLDGGFTQQDKDLLAVYRKIRSKYGWGGGLEQAFYTPADVEPALEAAVEHKRVTQEEADTLRQVFAQFKPRVEAMVVAAAPNAQAALDKARTSEAEFESLARAMARFTGCPQLTVTVYQIPSPSGGGGGGFNGGVLTLEVGEGADVNGTLLHEVFHAFLRTKQALLEKTASSVEGLDVEKLSEGLAYAFSPGMMGEGGLQRLRSAASEMAGRDLNEPYVAPNVYGLALQPLLKQALMDKDQTLETFLPRAVDAWLVLKSVRSAMQSESNLHDGHNYQTDPKHSILAFGSCDVLDRHVADALVHTFGLHFFGRPHQAQYYDELFTKVAKPGDKVMLLLSLDNPERVPEAYADLMPSCWPEVERKLRQGKTIVERIQSRKMLVLLIAALTKKKLNEQLLLVANDPNALGEITMSYAHAGTATIEAVYWKTAEALSFVKDLRDTDLVISVKEWLLDVGYRQHDALYPLLGHTLVLKASGQPDVRIRLNGAKYSKVGDSGVQVHGFGAIVDAQDRDKLKSGVTYTIEPVDVGKIPWQTRGATFTMP